LDTTGFGSTGRFSFNQSSHANTFVATMTVTSDRIEAGSFAVGPSATA
jgi:hypothetical protein